MKPEKLRQPCPSFSYSTVRQHGSLENDEGLVSLEGHSLTRFCNANMLYLQKYIRTRRWRFFSFVLWSYKFGAAMRWHIDTGHFSPAWFVSIHVIIFWVEFRWMIVFIYRQVCSSLSLYVRMLVEITLVWGIGSTTSPTTSTTVKWMNRMRTPKRVASHLRKTMLKEVWRARSQLAGEFKFCRPSSSSSTKT